MPVKKKLVDEWELPKGDVYEIWQAADSGTLAFHSYVRREHETTLCCHGTNSMNTIKQYYMDVKLAQQDIMNDKSNAKLHAYWLAYKKRRLSNPVSLNSTCHTQTTSSNTQTIHRSDTISSMHAPSSKDKANGKRVSFLC